MSSGYGDDWRTSQPHSAVETERVLREWSAELKRTGEVVKLERWDLAFESETMMGAFMEKRLAGKYVLYDEAVKWKDAAVAAAVKEAVDDGFVLGKEAAREVVAAIEHWTSYTPDDKPWECYASDPLAAIDALTTRGKGSV